MKRYAIVKNARTRREAEAYLPDNYKVIHETTETVGHPDDGWHEGYGSTPVFIIQGEDVAGWGLDTYVIPRCASGLIWVTEIDLSHPIMKHVPA